MSSVMRKWMGVCVGEGMVVVGVTVEGAALSTLPGVVSSLVRV